MLKAGFSHDEAQISQVYFPILSNWMSPLSLLGASGVIFHFYVIFDENHVSKQNSLRWGAAFCEVTSGAILFACPVKWTPGLYGLKDSKGV